MNKLKRFTTLLCFFLPWLNAEVTAEVVTEVTPRLFTLEKDNQTIYLFGSIHAGKPEFYPLPDYVTNNFDRADAVAFEIDMTDALSMSVGLASKQMKSMFTGDERLNDFLSSSEIEQIEAIMGKPINLKLKPAEYFLDLAAKFIEQSSLSVHHGVDMNLLQRAMKNEKRTFGLETMASQIAIFYDIPIDKQADLLSRGLKDWERQATLLDEMAEMWMTANPKILDFTLEEMKKQDPDGTFTEKLLYARNQDMADALITKQSQGLDTIFCTVGTMHIYGDRSVTDYLQQAGYTITKTDPN